MKKLFFVLLAATVLVSCKKSEDRIVSLTSPGMAAMVNGAAINFGVPTAEKQQSTGGDETIFVTGYTSDGKSIEISLSKQGGITAGTYGAANAALINLTDGSDFYQTTNTVTISIVANDATHIVGQFSGTVENASAGGASKTITEGKFYANF